jgi:hypothetical protein
VRILTRKNVWVHTYAYTCAHMYTKLTAAQTHFRKLNLGAQGAPKGSMALFFFLKKNYQKSARGTVSLSTTTTTTTTTAHSEHSVGDTLWHLDNALSTYPHQVHHIYIHDICIERECVTYGIERECVTIYAW